MFREYPLGELRNEVTTAEGQTDMSRVSEARCPFEGQVEIIGKPVIVRGYVYVSATSATAPSPCTFSCNPT